MRFDIDNFSGGVNNWGKPWAIDASEAVALKDADVSSGAIVSLTNKVKTDDTPALLDYLTTSRSVVKWSGQYYWSDNDDGTLNSTIGYVGIDPPSENVKIEFGGVGVKFLGEYRYRYRFMTDAGWMSAPLALSDDTRLNYVTIQCDREETSIDIGSYDEFDFRHFIHGDTFGYAIGSRVHWEGEAWEAIQDINGTTLAESEIISFRGLTLTFGRTSRLSPRRQSATTPWS